MAKIKLILEKLCLQKNKLKRGMKSRHLMMISIGGTIGI